MESKEPYFHNDGYYYEEVKWHTRQKHKFIEKYLDIWINSVAKKKNPPTLDIIDLFGSYGFCYCPELMGIGGGRDAFWEGSATLAARYLKRYPRPGQLLINTYNPLNEEHNAKQCENIDKMLNQYKLKPVPIVINKDISIATDFAIDTIKGHFPNLWILDPYAPSALPWETIERIASRDIPYLDRSGKTRKPELIITLMTYHLQKEINNHPEFLSDAFGVPEEDWRIFYDIATRDGLNATDFIGMYFSLRLETIYGRIPVYKRINQTTGGQIVFHIFFCSESDAGYYSMLQYGVKKYDDYVNSEWNEMAGKIRLKRKEEREKKNNEKKIEELKRQGQTFFDDF